MRILAQRLGARHATLAAVWLGVLSGAPICAGEALPAFRTSPVDDLMYAAPGLMQEVTALSAASTKARTGSLAYRAGVRAGPVLPFVSVRRETYDRVGAASASAVVGGEVDGSWGRLKGALGPRESDGVTYPKLESAALLQTSFGSSGYAAVQYADPVPLAGSDAVLRRSLNERQLSAYLESYAAWASGSLSPKVRQTREGLGGESGRGAELGGRLLLGRPDWRAGVGAWTYLLRWDARDPDLARELPRRYNFLGPYASAIVGPGGRDGLWRVVVSAGVGWDRSLPRADQRASFVEALVELGVSGRVGLKAGYALYAGNVAATDTPATRLVQLMLAGAL